MKVLFQGAHFHIIRKMLHRQPKCWLCVGGTGKFLVRPTFDIQAQELTFVHSLYLQMLSKDGHCGNNISAHWICSDASLWCIDGRPAPSGASWLRRAAYSRTRTRLQGGGGRGRKERRRRKVLSQQHEWIETGGIWRGKDVSRVNWGGWGQHTKHK